MKTYRIEYIGLIEIDANSEEDAYKIFQDKANAELGKYVHSAEILEDDLDE